MKVSVGEKWANTVHGFIGLPGNSSDLPETVYLIIIHRSSSRSQRGPRAEQKRN